VRWGPKRETRSTVSCNRNPNPHCTTPSAVCASTLQQTMVKKRKSIRKPPTVVIIEGEEQLFESTVGDVPAEDGMMMDGKKEEPANGFGEMVDGDAVEEEAEDEVRVRENALEEWNAFKEEYHESTCFYHVLHTRMAYVDFLFQLLNSSRCLCIGLWPCCESWMTKFTVRPHLMLVFVRLSIPLII